jgi:hypothetical protein
MVVIVSKAVRTVAITSVILLTLVGSVSANAASSGCLSTPALDAKHLVDSKALDNGVTAQGWQFSPGNDATDNDLSPLVSRVSVSSGNLRIISF